MCGGVTNDAGLCRGIYRIHPSFRIIALSEPPVVGSSSQQWLNAEMLTMFLYHHMRSLSEAEEVHVIGRLVCCSLTVVFYGLCVSLTVLCCEVYVDHWKSYMCGVY